MAVSGKMLPGLEFKELASEKKGTQRVWEVTYQGVISASSEERAVDHALYFIMTFFYPSKRRRRELGIIERMSASIVGRNPLKVRVILKPQEQE